ncbi:MAG: CAAX amino protease family protein [Mycoplasmataceae bacterium CE_OT135]|nr:MAG: CAAX amino protease family protein [Mycoplasmataceae bacterium CE_OT135]
MIWACQINSLSLSLTIKNLSIEFPYWCLFGVIAVGLAVLAFREQKEKIIHSWKKEKWKIIGTTLLYALLWCLFAGLLRQLLTELLTKGKQIEKPLNQQLIEQQIQQQKFSLWGQVLWGLYIIIWAPFFEELVFRWLVFETFGKNYLSVLISTLTFGFSHYWSGQSIVFALPYLIMGFALAYLYRKKNYNILWPMAFHFSNNLIAFIFLLARLHLK